MNNKIKKIFSAFAMFFLLFTSIAPSFLFNITYATPGNNANNPNIRPQEERGNTNRRVDGDKYYVLENHKVISQYNAINTFESGKSKEVFLISIPTGLKKMYFDFSENNLRNDEKVFLIKQGRNGTKNKEVVHTITRGTGNTTLELNNTDTEYFILGFSKKQQGYGGSIKVSAYEKISDNSFYNRAPQVVFNDIVKFNVFKTFDGAETVVSNALRLDFPGNSQDRYSDYYISPGYITSATITWNTESCCDSAFAYFYNDKGNEILVDPNSVRGNGSKPVTFTVDQKVKRIKLRYTTDGSRGEGPIVVSQVKYVPEQTNIPLNTDVNFTKTSYVDSTILNPIRLPFPGHGQSKTVEYVVPNGYLKYANFSWDVESCNDRATVQFFNESGGVVYNSYQAMCNSGTREQHFLPTDKVKKIKLVYSTDGSVERGPITVNNIIVTSLSNVSIMEEPFNGSETPTQPINIQNSNVLSLPFPGDREDRYSETYNANGYITSATITWNTESCCDSAFAYFYNEDGILVTTDPNGVRGYSSKTVNFTPEQKIKQIKLRYTTDSSRGEGPITVSSVIIQQPGKPADTVAWGYSYTPTIHNEILDFDKKWGRHYISRNGNRYFINRFINNVSSGYNIHNDTTSKFKIVDNKKLCNIEDGYTQPNAENNGYNVSFPANENKILCGMNAISDKTKLFTYTPLTVKNSTNPGEFITGHQYNNIDAGDAGIDAYRGGHPARFQFSFPGNSQGGFSRKYKNKDSSGKYILTYHNKISGNTETREFNEVEGSIPLNFDRDDNFKITYHQQNYNKANSELEYLKVVFGPVSDFHVFLTKNIAEHNVIHNGKTYPQVGVEKAGVKGGFITDMVPTLDINQETNGHSATYSVPEMNTLGQGLLAGGNYVFNVVNNPLLCHFPSLSNTDLPQTIDSPITLRGAKYVGKYLCLIHFKLSNSGENTQNGITYTQIAYPYAYDKPIVNLEVKRQTGFGVFVSQQMATQNGGEGSGIVENSFETYLTNDNACNDTTYNNKIFVSNHTPNNFGTIQKTDTVTNITYNSYYYAPLPATANPATHNLLRLQNEDYNNKYLCARAKGADDSYGYSNPVHITGIDTTPPSITIGDITPTGITKSKRVNVGLFDNSNITSFRYTFVNEKSQCAVPANGAQDPLNLAIWENKAPAPTSTFTFSSELLNGNYVCVEATDEYSNKTRVVSDNKIENINIKPPVEPSIGNPYSFVLGKGTIRLEINTPDKDIKNYKVVFTKGINSLDNETIKTKEIPFREDIKEIDGTSTTIAIINDLPEGDYKFTVQARDIGNLESPVSSGYSFSMKETTTNHPEFIHELTNDKICSSELYKLLSTKYLKSNVQINKISCLMAEKPNAINFLKIGDYQLRWEVTFTGSKTLTLLESLSQLGKMYPEPGQPILDPTKQYTLSLDTTFSGSTNTIEPLFTKIILKETGTENLIINEIYRNNEVNNGINFHVLNLPVVVLDINKTATQPDIIDNKFLYYEKRFGIPGSLKIFNINAYKWYTSFAACNGTPCEKKYFLQWKGFNDNTSAGVDLRNIQADIFFDKDGSNDVDPIKELVSSINYKIPDDKYFTTNRIEFPRSSIEVDPTIPENLMVKTEIKGFLEENNAEFLRKNKFLLLTPDENKNTFKKEPLNDIKENQEWRTCFRYVQNGINDNIVGFNRGVNCPTESLTIPALSSNNRPIGNVSGLSNLGIRKLQFEEKDTPYLVKANAFSDNLLKELEYTKNLKITLEPNAFRNNPGYNNTGYSGIILYTPRNVEELGYITNNDISHFNVIGLAFDTSACYESVGPNITNYFPENHTECVNLLEIPGSLKGNNITNIKTRAFKNKNLTGTIILPSTVNMIEEESFAYNNIESINLNNISNFGNNALAYNNIKKINNIKYDFDMYHKTFHGNKINSIDEDSRNRLRTMLYHEKNGVLYYCDSTCSAVSYINRDNRNIVIADKIDSMPVTEILNGAFQALSAGNEERAVRFNDAKYTLKIGKNVQVIEDNAFESTLIDKVEIPDSVTRIGSSAFYNSGISTLILGNGLKDIGTLAFNNNFTNAQGFPATKNGTVKGTEHHKSLFDNGVRDIFDKRYLKKFILQDVIGGNINENIILSLPLENDLMDTSVYSNHASGIVDFVKNNYGHKVVSLERNGVNIKLNNRLTFDGNLTEPINISFWAKNNSQWGAIFQLCGNNSCIGLSRPSADTVKFGARPGNQNLGKTVNIPNELVGEEKWIHYSLIYHNNNTKLYINGEFIDEYTGETNGTCGAGVKSFIGKNPTGAVCSFEEGFSGEISKFRIFKGETNDGVQSLLFFIDKNKYGYNENVNIGNLLGYYPLNGNFNDTTGNNYLTAKNPNTLKYFNYSDSNHLFIDRLEPNILKGENIPFEDNFTIHTFIKSNPTLHNGDKKTLFHLYDKNNKTNNIKVVLTEDGYIKLLRPDGTAVEGNYEKIQFGAFNHIALVNEGDIKTLYVNFEPVSTLSLPGLILKSLSILADEDNTNNFYGNIDELYLVNGALDEDDMLDIRDNYSDITSIWNRGKYIPNEDTVFYYPLKNSLGEASGSGIGLTKTKGEEEYKNNGLLLNNKNAFLFNVPFKYLDKPNINGTFNIWIKNDSYGEDEDENLGAIFHSNETNDGFLLSNLSFLFIGNGEGYFTKRDKNPSVLGLSGYGWDLLTFVMNDNGQINIYINGTLFGTKEYNKYSTPINESYYLGLNETFPGEEVGDKFKAYIAEILLEKRAWTADEVLDYYNKTRSDLEVEKINCFHFNKTDKKIIGYRDHPSCSKDVVIPEMINNTPVEKIGYKAFYGLGLRSVSFPTNSSVKEIEGSAFAGNILDNELILPNSLRILGPDSFSHHSLKRLVLNDGLENIGNYAFATNGIYNPGEGIGVVNIPSSVTNIGNWAFWGAGFTGFNIPDVVYNRTGLFYSNKFLFKKTGTTTARIEYNGLGTNFEIPNTIVGKNGEVLTLQATGASNLSGGLMFKNGTTGKGHKNINITIDPMYSSRNKLHFIDGYLIKEQNNHVDILRNYNIPDDGIRIIQPTYLGKPVKVIGNGGFRSQPIKSITIPDTVEKIDVNAFYRNELNSVVLPNGIKTLGNYAFKTDHNLEDIKTKAGSYDFAGYKFDPATGVMLKRDNEFWKVSYPTKKYFEFPVNIDNRQVVAIDSAAFRGLNLPSLLELPYSITAIYSEAFLGTGIENIKFINNEDEINAITGHKTKGGLRVIGNRAFMANPLTKIAVPPTLNRILTGAFIGAKGDTTVNGKVRLIYPKGTQLNNISLADDANAILETE